MKPYHLILSHNYQKESRRNLRMAGKSFVVVMMVLLVLFASEESMMKGTEGKMCQVSNPSRFGCVNDHTCLSSCEKKGFSDGKCQGLTRKCVCSKPC